MKMIREGGRKSVAAAPNAAFSDSSDSSAEEVGITDMENKRIKR